MAVRDEGPTGNRPGPSKQGRLCRREPHQCPLEPFTQAACKGHPTHICSQQLVGTGPNMGMGTRLAKSGAPMQATQQPQAAGHTCCRVTARACCIASSCCRRATCSCSSTARGPSSCCCEVAVWLRWCSSWRAWCSLRSWASADSLPSSLPLSSLNSCRGEGAQSQRPSFCGKDAYAQCAGCSLLALPPPEGRAYG